MAKKRFPYLPLERSTPTSTPPPEKPRMYNSLFVNPCAVCTPQKEVAITVMTADTDAKVVFVAEASAHINEDHVCDYCRVKLFPAVSETETLLHRSIWPVSKKPNA